MKKLILECQECDVNCKLEAHIEVANNFDINYCPLFKKKKGKWARTIKPITEEE